MERYILVEGRDYGLSKFKEEVNKKIAGGYTPLGSPIINPRTTRIIQAMFLPTEIASLKYRYPSSLG